MIEPEQRHGRVLLPSRDDLGAYYEEDRGAPELRVTVIGRSSVSRLLFVVFIEEDDVVRIISAR